LNVTSLGVIVFMTFGMFQMGVFQEPFIGVCARDAYYQKERVSARNGAEWDVASVRVFGCR
jgi:hypothetical protein